MNHIFLNLKHISLDILNGLDRIDKSDSVYISLVDKPKEKILIKPILCVGSGFPKSDYNLRDIYQPREMGCSIGADIIVIKRQVLLEDYGRKLSPLSFFRKNMQHHGSLSLNSENKYVLRRSNDLTNEITYIDEEAYYIDSDYVDIYGHILIEIIPRLWCYDKFNMPLIVGSNKISEILKQFFDLLDIPISRYKQITGPTFFSKLIVPDMPIYKRQWVHPVALDVFSKLKVKVGSLSLNVKTPENIYISRSNVASRKLINEDEVEQFFIKKGFEIIYPENYSLAEQIHMFSKAKRIVGPGGSAMHNAVFSEKDAKVLILCSEGWFVNADIILNQVEGKLGYIFGNRLIMEDKRTQGDWSIDLNDVVKGFDNFFNM